MVGKTLSHYRVLDKLGAGGMGEVYLAEDTTLKRRVALKVLPSGLASSQERLERFQREAEFLAALNHPNIVHIFSVEKDQGVDFLTMELVEGRPLSEEVPNSGMPLERFFEIAIPLADALAAAHAKGVIHRDLKPSNVMVTSEGRAKVLDFGLAKLTPSEVDEAGETRAPTLSLETEPGTVMGTVGYMSPEQVRGEPIDRRSDIFSLGALLYEMATGRRAFDAQSRPDVMSAILRDDPPPVDEPRPDLPHHLGRVIRRCLEKDPGRRYQSAQDICHDLEDLFKELEREAILGSRPGSAVPKEKPRGFRWGVVLVVVAVVMIVAAAYQLVRRGVDGSPTTDRAKITSLAVLPFDNLMNDPEQEYFVEGMHEALIANLSKISALRVISRTSAMRYKETDKSLPQIAQQLDVDALIEGSVLRADGQVRITAQLIDGVTDQNLWAASYDRELENVLALLSDVARSIADEIEVTLTPKQQQRLEAVRQVDPAAHEAYLQGQYHFHKFWDGGWQRSLEFYEKAVEIEPGFAPAWAGIGYVWAIHAIFETAPMEEAVRKARTAGNKAVELDPDLGSGHAVLGFLTLYIDWNWEGAKLILEKALALNPTDVMVRHAYADYLLVVGNLDESVRQVRLGQQSDPLSPVANFPVFWHLVYSNRNEEALAEGRAILQRLPDDRGLRGDVAWLLWHMGSYEEAFAHYEAAWGSDYALLEALRTAYLEAGPLAASRAAAEFMETQFEAGEANALDVSSWYADAGDRDRALEWLERACDARTPMLIHLKGQPSFNSLRDDPRFQQLMQRIGFPE